MSERDELRERLIELLQDDNLPDWLADERRVDGEMKADAVLAEIERTHRVIPVELYERFVRAIRVTEACHNCASGAGIWFDEDELTL